MCFWSKCLDISDVKRAFVANVLIYQMSDMIIRNMHVYFINRILKTELLFILCSGQKCLQFYLTFTSCLPLPLLTFCQIKNIEENMCPGGQRYFQDLELLQVVINSLSQLFVRLCHATLWNRDHAISSSKVKVKSLKYFS